jgi:signal transduction histidine kinase
MGEGTAAARGTARYWIDGTALDTEFGRMDRALLLQAGIAWGAAAAAVGLILAWAFARLTRANEEVAARSADLARANQELAFAAKTGAVGAISAHLIHGLKNPLAGLEGFVLENAATAAAPVDGEAWRTAVDTTRRLRELVNEVTTVLRDEAGDAPQYRVPVNEVLDAVVSRTAPAANTAGVGLELSPPPPIEISARAANLARLVLVNLTANAIEASPRGGRVRLEARLADGAVEFLVRDSGPGLAAEIRPRLFQPVPSTKAAGGGIGLAISRQIARHAGGDLQLAESTAQGCTFRLRIPAEL